MGRQVIVVGILCILFYTPKCIFETKDLLILYDDDKFLNTYTILISLVKDLLKNVDFIKINDHLKLIEFDKLKYSNILLSITKSNNILLQQILNHVDNKGNLMIMSSLNPLDFNKIITEFGFIGQTNSILIDHNNTYNDKWIKLDNTLLCDCDQIIGKINHPILYNGYGFLLDKSNPMTFPILTSSPSAYLTKDGIIFNKNSIIAGTNIILIGGVEMRNSARAIIIGSTEIFNDKIIMKNKHDTNDNLLMLINMIQWYTQKKGVLRIIDYEHGLSNGMDKNLSEYIVDTELEYKITIQQLDENGEWIPFICDDIQLELIRLTTFAIVNYRHIGGGKYLAKFYAPDFIGTYGLHTRYRRLGYTYLDHMVKIVIRPRKHTDYDRFILGAFPYYVTTFSMVILVFLLVFVLLNSNQPKQKIN